MIKLNSLFSDGVVLQRRKPVAVWGQSSPRTRILCEINGTVACTSTSITGNFLLRLPAMEAGGPYTMIVTAGSESAVVKDVMIGEVWLASGQSNMEFPMRSFSADFYQADKPKQTELEKKFLSEKHDPASIRMFTVARRCLTARETETVNGGWQYADADHISSMSAVALFFARTLQEKLGVTIGIIHSSWGGTFVEAWTSRATLMANPDCQAMLAKYDEVLPTEERWKNVDFSSDLGVRDDPNLALNSPEGRMKFFQEYCTLDTENTGFEKGWAAPALNDSDWSSFLIPGVWTYRKTTGNGVVWIRLDVKIPNSWAGKDLVLHTGGIDKHDVTYFNGQEIGRTGRDFEESFWNVQRRYPVPGKLVHAGSNLIAIRNCSFAYDGGFGGIPEQYYLENPENGERVPLSGDCRLAVEKDYGPVSGGGMTTAPRPMGPGCSNSCAMLFDAMIRPLLPYSLCGFIWYQGEQNGERLNDALSYRRKMSDLIRDWRFHFEQGDLPFLQVQLANYRSVKPYSDGDLWPVLRESQRLSSLDVPNAGMAVTLDAGDAVDIHPKDKVTVGERLGAWALKNTYGVSGIAPEGPVFREKYREGHFLRLRFEPNGKLVLKKAKGSGFYVSADGAAYEAAECVIDGDTLLLSSKNVSSPLFVRYAWADNPENLTLYNDAGIPASSFQA